MVPLRRIELLVGLAVILVVFTVGWWESNRRPPVIMEVLPPDRSVEIKVQRSLARIKVIRQVLAKEVSLLQAAAKFRDINASPPDCPCDFRRDYPGDSDGEKLCRQVLTWVKQQTEDDAGLAELECEFEHLRVTRQLELP